MKMDREFWLYLGLTICLVLSLAGMFLGFTEDY